MRDPTDCRPHVLQHSDTLTGRARVATGATMTPVPARLTISGWHGVTSYSVALVGSTPKRRRIMAMQPLRLPRRGRTLEPGDVALVPATAVSVVGTSAEPYDDWLRRVIAVAERRALAEEMGDAT